MCVVCVLNEQFIHWFAPSILNQVVGTLFSHHQKCVVLDTQASGNNRKITAFIGGLDLCDGRYDTPEHRLFHDLDTVFADDFHNPTFTVSSCLTYQELSLWLIHVSMLISVGVKCHSMNFVKSNYFKFPRFYVSGKFLFFFNLSVGDI